MKNLLPLSAFVTIVCFFLLPLSQIGGIYGWPCSYIAQSLFVFYLGCLIAEAFVGKIGTKGLKIMTGLAVFLLVIRCVAQVLRLFLVPQLWILYIIIYLLIGFAVNSSSLRNNKDDRFWKDFANGCAGFVLYMILDILTQKSVFYQNISWISMAMLQTVSKLLVIYTLVYVYKCVQSEKVAGWIAKLPLLARILASFCPGVIFVIFLRGRSFHEWWHIALIPVLSFALSVAFRFVVKLIKLIKKELNWKEVILG